MAPADWATTTIQPDPLLPANGFYDVLALNVPINMGASLEGFSVRFSWLGAGTPADQLFSVLDPVSFQALDTGLTQPRQVTAPPTAVPEPGVVSLMIAAGFGLMLSRRKERGA